MKFISTLAMLCLFLQTSAQIKWNFTTDANPSAGIPGNMTVSAVTRTNGGGGMLVSNASVSNYITPPASGTNNVVASVPAGGLNTASSTYFEITLTPAAGYKISFTAIGFGTRSTASGPTNISVRTNLDTYTADVFTTTSLNGSWSYRQSPNFTVLGNDNTALTIRIYGHTATGGTSNWRVDDIAITAAVISTTPLILNDLWLSGNKMNVIKWRTANEVNVDRFEIQGSENAKDMKPIGMVIAKNRTMNEYSFEDISGNNYAYYRLKMIDKDGTFSYSRMLRSAKKDILNVFKPLGLDHLVIQGSSEGMMNVYDINGRNIQSTKFRDNKIQLKGHYRYMEYYQAIIKNKEGEFKIRFLNR